MTLSAISIFSGPGGVCTGLANTDLIDTIVGVEWDADAVATAMAAGHKVVHDDVRNIDPLLLASQYGMLSDDLLLQGSPPCQGLSMAGKGAGRQDLDALLFAVLQLAWSDETPRWSAAQYRIPELLADLEGSCSDDRSPLTFEVMRWIFGLSPDYIMLEQVPAALPIWEAIAEVLRSWGYSVWTGNVQAEQFGVPQTRKRAILLASRVGKVEAPVPTHSRYYNRDWRKLDDGVLPWVSMAEALHWGMTERPSYTVTGGGTATGGAETFGNGSRKGMAKQREAGAWIERDDLMLCPTNLRPNAALRRLDQPAPTMAFGHETPRWVTPEEFAEYKARVAAKAAERENNQSGTAFDLGWPAERPAPTVAGREIVTMPGANANRFNGSTKSRNDGLRVTVEEAGVLQSFPWDYPWQGTKTSKFQQVGNAVPPVLQQALTLHLVGKVEETMTPA